MKRTAFLCLSFALSFLFPVYAANDQETLTTTSGQRTISVALPRRSISPSQVAILANLQDIQSVNTAAYYAQVRNIPVENIIYLSFTPARTFIRENEFKTLKAQVDTAAAKLPDIQAYAITWTEPWAVYHPTMARGMSITSAFAMGFDAKHYNDVSSATCEATSPSGMYNSSTFRPYSDLGIRPAMMLGGTNFTNVKALIDRGKLANLTFPAGRGYMIRTSDNLRSVRYQNFISTANFWNRPDGVAMTYIDNSAGAVGNTIVNKNDMFLYLTGLTSIANLTSNQYVPGSIGDHLTSYGGMLTGPNTQMSALRWLEAGTTGSYGTVEEPCAYESKFTNAFEFTRHYFTGATLLEAYWKSVQTPGEGIFIGDPLARPYGTQISVDTAGQLNIKTSILKPKMLYTLQGGDSPNGPWTMTYSGITTNDSYGLRTLKIAASKNFYVLKEEPDPTLPLLISLSNNFSYPATNGQQIVWHSFSTSYSAVLNIYDFKTKAVTPLPVNIVGPQFPLMFENTKIVYRERQFINKAVHDVFFVFDTVTQQKLLLKQVLMETVSNVFVNQGRLFWTGPEGITAIDLNTGISKVVEAGVRVKINAIDVDGSFLAFTSENDDQVVIKNLTNGTYELVPHTIMAHRSQIRVMGSTVYWLEKDIWVAAQMRVMAYDMNTKTIGTVTAVNGTVTSFFKVTPGWIVWATKPEGAAKESLYAYNMMLKTTEMIKTGANDYLSNSEGNQSSVTPYVIDLAKNSLVWVNFSQLGGNINIYAKELSNGLVGHWTFDESAGTVAVDSVNNNHGTLFNGPLPVTGKIGKALSFDGGNDYAQVNHSPVLELGKNGADFSVAYWMNLKQGFTGSWRSILHKGATSMTERTPAMWMYPTDNRILLCASTTVNTNTCAVSSQEIPLNNWVHVAYIKTRAGLALYINGNFQGGVRLGGSSVSNTAPIYIGKDPWHHGVNAILDDLQLYNRALSQVEVRTLAAVMPYITGHPISLPVRVGQQITFMVSAGGPGPLSYQWRKNGVNISGATASSYTITPAVSADHGSKFSVTVTNAYGSVTSAPADLVIIQ
jgi:uncharacterized protein (TIGR03790 family)